jgi:hypothetical protein
MQTRSAALALFVLALLAVDRAPTFAGEPTSRVKTVRVPGAEKVVRAARAADGTIHVLFDSSDGPKYAASTDGGATFGAAIAIVDAASTKPGLVYSGEDLVLGKGGRVHVALSTNAWKLKLPKEQWGLHYASLAPGAKTFTALRNITKKPCEGFSLAADDRGDVTACFLCDKLFVMTSHDEGQTFGAAAELDTSWNPCNCCTTSATYGADGRLALLYREETKNERDMYVVLWDQRAGTKSRARVSGESWKIDSCPMTYFTVAPTPTGYTAAWPTKGAVYFARLDKNGAAVAPGEIKTPGTSGMRTGVLTLSAADGGVLVAWKDKDVLGWQIYDAAGKPGGDAASAPSKGGGAAGVALPDGTFVLFP